VVQALYQSTLRSLPLLGRGKVRDLYAVGDDKLLIVATDRLSAFDVILDDPVPGKGQVLTALTQFWLSKLGHIVPNHMTGIDPLDVVAPEERDQVTGRAMVVKRLQPILFEAVARGYLIGSGWDDYQATGAVCGIRLPPGLQQAQALPYPIFTPAAKAAIGEHDENVDFATVQAQLGDTLAQELRRVTLALYTEAAHFAASKGILIADTKFEFGLDDNGVLHLMDEVLTPDSSRFWPAARYRPGISPPSFDKQFIRDWLQTQPWNKTAPAPKVPQPVLAQTAAKYREALDCLTTAQAPVVGVLMGSASDWDVMRHAVELLREFDVPHEVRVVSAHRMPHDMVDYGTNATERGLRAIIAGAGGAAHLPGMLAALTPVPVFGVPVPSRYLRGEDSLHSIVQMPKGIPVATFAIGEAGAANAALHVVACLAMTDTALRERLVAFRNKQTEAARAMRVPPAA